MRTGNEGAAGLKWSTDLFPLELTIKRGANQETEPANQLSCLTEPEPDNYTAHLPLYYRPVPSCWRLDMLLIWQWDISAACSGETITAMTENNTSLHNNRAYSSLTVGNHAVNDWNILYPGQKNRLSPESNHIYRIWTKTAVNSKFGVVTWSLFYRLLQTASCLKKSLITWSHKTTLTCQILTWQHYPLVRNHLSKSGQALCNAWFGSLGLCLALVFLHQQELRTPWEHCIISLHVLFYIFIYVLFSHLWSVLF